MPALIAERARGRRPTGERQRIVSALKAHEAELRARGVTSLALFGSLKPPFWKTKQITIVAARLY